MLDRRNKNAEYALIYGTNYHKLMADALKEKLKNREDMLNAFKLNLWENKIALDKSPTMCYLDSRDTPSTTQMLTSNKEDILIGLGKMTEGMHQVHTALDSAWNSIINELKKENEKLKIDLKSVIAEKNSWQNNYYEARTRLNDKAVELDSCYDTIADLSHPE